MWPVVKNLFFKFLEICPVKYPCMQSYISVLGFCDMEISGNIFLLSYYVSPCTYLYIFLIISLFSGNAVTKVWLKSLPTKLKSCNWNIKITDPYATQFCFWELTKMLTIICWKASKTRNSVIFSLKKFAVDYLLHWKLPPGNFNLKLWEFY